MIDTNILLDWLLDRDQVRTKLVDDLIAKSDELFIADIGLVELVFVLEKHYKLPREVVCQNLTKVLDEPKFKSNRSLFRSIVTPYLLHSGLSFIDCYLVQYSEIHKAKPFWTFDKKLANQSSGIAKLLT